ncbi:MAG: hypothetical protein R6V73_11605 [Anaerolineales bacterium]
MPVISAQKTVTTAGSPEALGTLRTDGPLMIKALDGNTDIVAIGNDGSNSVSLTTGMRLSAGEAIVFEFVGSLQSLYLDVAVDGEGVAWIALNL